jgi:hypothetical protein
MTDLLENTGLQTAGTRGGIAELRQNIDILNNMYT